MQDLLVALEAEIPNIVDRWLAYVDRPPWAELSAADRLDDLPRFLTTMFAEMGSSQSLDVDHLNFLDAAAAHGTQRRQLGLGYDHVMEESSLLRRAVWEFAKPHQRHVQEIAAVDAGLTVGLLASLRGYSKPELTARGEWKSSLARLAFEWGSLLDDA
jgi:hypothetical protein